MGGVYPGLSNSHTIGRQGSWAAWGLAIRKVLIFCKEGGYYNTCFIVLIIASELIQSDNF